MNYLKKKLKPFTSGLTSAASNATQSNLPRNNHKSSRNQDLENDLYDEYVVEAPPHPSELLALGVDPSEIDVNNPERLKELYRKAKEEGKDKVTNSLLLAKQRMREEIEEKKKTREEWKFFDSITARVEQAVRDSQKTLEQLKETSAIDQLKEPEYELRLTPDQVFKASNSVKQEKSANDWIDFDDDKPKRRNPNKVISLDDEDEDEEANFAASSNKSASAELDEFGCPIRKPTGASSDAQNPVVRELFEDLGIDLRPPEQRKAAAAEAIESAPIIEPEPALAEPESRRKPSVDLKRIARPRPRSNAPKEGGEQEEEEDPFDTSFVSSPLATDSSTKAPSIVASSASDLLGPVPPTETSAANQTVDPFDTSHIAL